MFARSLFTPFSCLLECERCIQVAKPGYGNDGKQKWFRPPSGIMNAVMQVSQFNTVPQHVLSPAQSASHSVKQAVLRRNNYRSVLGDVWAFCCLIICANLWCKKRVVMHTSACCPWNMRSFDKHSLSALLCINSFHFCQNFYRYANDIFSSSQPDWIVDFMMLHCAPSTYMLIPRFPFIFA